MHVYHYGAYEAGGHQAPDGPLRHPRGGGGPPPARPRPRRPLLASSARACGSRRSRTRSRRSRSSTCRSARARRPAPASPSSSTRSGWRPGPAVDPRRPRRLQQGRLRLDLDDADLAGGPAEGSRGGIRDRARPAEGRGRRADRRAGRAARGDAQARRGADEGRPRRRRRAHGEQHARWILAQLLDWHRREAKPQLVAPLHPDEGRRSRSSSPRPTRIGELTFDRQVGTVKQSILYRYRYDPEQEHKFREGDGPSTRPRATPPAPSRPSTPPPASIDLKRGKSSDAPHPKALDPRHAAATTGAARRAAASGRRGDRHGIDGAGPLPRRPRPAARPAAQAPRHADGAPLASPARSRWTPARRAGPRPRRRLPRRSRARPARARPTWARG